MQDTYREIFLTESQEYLNMISQSLVKLEKTPSDSESLNKIFRAVHSLKGMSATLEFEKLTRLSHYMEDLLDGLRSQKVKVNPKIIDVLFSCLDFLEALIEEIRLNKESSIDISHCLDILQKCLSPCEKTKKSLNLIPEGVTEFTDSENKKMRNKRGEGFNIFKIKITLAEDCVMKQVRAFLVVTNLGRMGEIIKSFPSIAELKENWFEFSSSFMVVLAIREEAEVIRQEVMGTSDIKDVEIEALEVFSGEQKAISQEETVSYVKKIQSIRIPVHRLDKIMNLTGELAIAKIRLVQIVHSLQDNSLEEVTSAIEHLTTTLQDEVMQTRLLPISYVLDAFPRMVRDLARKQNKEVELEIVGSEIELDRTILDEIGDPLVHLIRNVIDHGIETPEERNRINKNSQGRLLIKISRQKGQISLEIADDGRGIDFAAVGRLALKKGLLSEEDVAKLDKPGILNLLTLPGFSTKEEVSEISGRGVGLDVVKAKVEALTGALDFETTLGVGTRFILTLPLTLAIIKAMLIGINRETFALPLMSIREIVKIEKQDLKLINNFEVIRVRNEIIPIIRLDKELELSAFSQTTEEEKRQNEKISVLIIEYGAKSIGLIVDNVLGEQDIVVRPLGSMVKRIRGIAGATILASGKVALILDVMSLR